MRGVDCRKPFLGSRFHLGVILKAVGVPGFAQHLKRAMDLLGGRVGLELQSVKCVASRAPSAVFFRCVSARANRHGNPPGSAPAFDFKRDLIIGKQRAEGRIRRTAVLLKRADPARPASRFAPLARPDP
jgi:hypothetical protein